ncbi:hypothetical protein LTR86_006746 [Recurvomyces mirabilis]|nr:hypothetical protein LTR86_006746 [Recurvomyces mirabilis]
MFRQQQAPFHQQRQALPPAYGILVPQNQYSMAGMNMPLNRASPMRPQSYLGFNQPAHNPAVTPWLADLPEMSPYTNAPLLTPTPSRSQQFTGPSELASWAPAPYNQRGMPGMPNGAITPSQQHDFFATPAHRPAVPFRSPSVMGSYLPGGPYGPTIQPVHANWSGQSMLPASPPLPSQQHGRFPTPAGRPAVPLQSPLATGSHSPGGSYGSTMQPVHANRSPPSAPRPVIELTQPEGPIDLTEEEEYDDTQDAPGSPDPDYVVDFIPVEAPSVPEPAAPKSMGFVQYMSKNWLKPAPNRFTNGTDGEEKTMEFSNLKCTEREYEELKKSGLKPSHGLATRSAPKKKDKGKCTLTSSKSSKRGRVVEDDEKDDRAAKRHSPSKKTASRPQKTARHPETPVDEPVFAESSTMALAREDADMSTSAQSLGGSEEPIAGIEVVEASTTPIVQETTESEADLDEEFSPFTSAATEEAEESDDDSGGELVVEGEIGTGEVTAAEEEQDQTEGGLEMSADDLTRELRLALEEEDTVPRAQEAFSEYWPAQMDHESEESEEE